MSETMVERVARIIDPHAGWKECSPNCEYCRDGRRIAIEQAVDVIKAMREPTGHMLEAGYHSVEGTYPPAANVWRAMIDCALSEAEGERG